MLNSNFYLTERMVALRVEEEHRQAEARRLLAEARAGRTGWLSRQCCRALCQLGRFLVSLGQRFLQDVAPPSLPLEGHVGSRA
jgi:hypothetical protein